MYEGAYRVKYTLYLINLMSLYLIKGMGLIMRVKVFCWRHHERPP